MLKLEIIEHGGNRHETEVESYDAAAIFLAIKEGQNGTDHVVLIGDVIIDSRSIKSVVQVKSEIVSE